MARGAEVNHQATSEKVERNGKHEKPLESASDSDQVTTTEKPDRVHEIEDRSDITGLSEAGVEHDLQEGCEVACPAVIGDLVCDIQKARADDGTIAEKRERDERLWCTPSLINDEGDQDAETDDHHRDDLR